MLFLVEKILFALAVIATLYAAGRAIERLVRIIGRGYGKVDWSLVPRRLIEVIAGLGIFESGDPWQLPYGAGYSKISYKRIEL
jgi:hypothetical protein